MNVDDLKPFPASRFGGQIDYQDPTKVINGSALLAQMVRFLPDQVGTCFGTVDTMRRPQFQEEVTGINVLNVLGVLNPRQIPVVFGDGRSLLQENPPGSGAMIPLAPPFTLPLDARMQSADAENTLTMAFSDGTKGLCPPLRLNGITGQLAAAQNPIGGLWSKDLIYQTGDLVRSPDGRWWRCTVSAIGPGSVAGPQWPQFNGYFSGGTNGAFATPGAWNPATATDALGSVWEEWTPACVQFVPAPDVSNVAAVHNPGGGTIPAGKDVYVKLVYRNPSLGGSSPRSAAIVFQNTSANDAITIGQNGTGGVVTSNGGVNMPRWIAEIFLQQPSFWVGNNMPIEMYIYVAIVAHGAAAPADSAYVVPVITSSGVLSPGLPITITAAGSGAILPTNGCPVPYVGAVVPSNIGAEMNLGAFIGEFGTRYMIVTRYNKNGSLAPVDPGSAIPISLVGELQLPIVTILRDASGNVSCTVGDVTIGWIIGNEITVAGCTGDATFNGQFALTNVQPTLNPQGILSWTDVAHMSASNDETGSVTLPAGPPAVAFLPPGGPNDLEDIAGFTVVDGSAAGPFFYISEAPEAPAVTSILAAEGGKVLDFAGQTLTRDAGGYVEVTLADIAGIQTGMLLTVLDAADPSFDGEFSIEGVSPGTGTGGVISWSQPDTTATSTTATVTVQSGDVGGVQVTVQDASQFAPGDTCLLDTGSYEATGLPTAFDGVVTIASISADVVTVASLATGSATIYPAYAFLSKLPNMPTCSPAAPQTILSISRDAKGNVLASVGDIGGYAQGNSVTVTSVPTVSFDGSFRVLGVKANADGVTGTLIWAQNPNTGAAVDNSGIGTVGAVPDIFINYQDELLIAEQDNEITDQLNFNPPPPAADVYFVPSLRKYVYARGTDSLFLFSETDDAENLNLSTGQLSVDDNSMSLAVCVREARTGEIIALKADAGYAINPSDLPPSEWPCPTRWSEHGPPCAAAVGKGTDFLVFPSFWSQAGCYLYRGGTLSWLTKEFQKAWDRVNRDALNTIWTIVDEQEKEIQIGVPLDGATTPSHIIVGSYIAGWGEEQEVLNRYGKLITARAAVRWSIRPRATRTAAVVRRSLAAPVNSLGDNFPFATITRTGGVVTASYTGSTGALNPTLTRAGGAVYAIVGAPVTIPFAVGDTVPLSGATDASFDGNFLILSITPQYVGGNLTSYEIVWNQAGPNAISGGPTVLGIPIPRVLPPVIVPGGSITIAGVADASFDGTFVITASTVNSLSWLQAGADGASGVGNSYITLVVPAPSTDERVQSRQVLLGPSGSAVFQTVLVVSADRRTGLRGDGSTGGVLTLRFNGPLDGNVTDVIVTGMDDPSFDGEYTHPCTAAWGPDGVHAILQFKTTGVTGVSYGGTLQSTMTCLRVVMQDPARLDDNGAGLDSRYTPALFAPGGLMVVRWGAFNVQIGGTGKISLIPQTEDPAAIFEPIVIDVTGTAPRRLQEGLRVPDNEYLTLEVTNGNKPGVGFILQDMILYGVPIFSGRRV